MSATPSPGEAVHGFRITRVDTLPELRAGVVEAAHIRTGARLLHVAAADRENLFGVAFSSPPADNCGTAHIIEHAVLAGSRRYPVKDPFVEMLKSSMATFINAFTCSDRTLYPVASNVTRDFFNLVEVYLDAVFHPLISRDTLMQEGWHWATRPGAGGGLRLEPKGVVLNEMRGAFSDLEALVERETAARLFPLGTYGLDAGGEPHCIPDLTYEAFTACYRRTYHPANARFFLYGDIPLEDKLRFLDARLADLDPGPFTAPVIVRQPPWPRPRQARVMLYGLPEDESACAAATTVNWVVGDLADAETDLAWELLDRLLLGDDAAPLRRQLLESGLGDDLTYSGYVSDSLQTVFQVGVKGGVPVAGHRLERVVLETLGRVAAAGFEPARVSDALRQLEYSHREIDSGFPLHLMEDAFCVWLYGLDPLVYLRPEVVLSRLRGRLAGDPGLLPRMIARDLLTNPHRLTLVLRPQPGRRPERERRLLQRARAVQRSLSAAELGRLGEQSAALERRQSQPNRPEALAALPVLRADDLPREPAAIRTASDVLPNGIETLRHDVPSNGISYITAAFELSGLPQTLLPYVPAFSAFLTRLGTARRDYAGLSEAVTRATGGVIGAAHISPRPGTPGAARPFLLLQARTLDETCEAAVDLLREMLEELDTAAVRRLTELLVQRRARMLTGVVSQGHHIAALQAAEHLGDFGRLANLWRGRPQIQWAHTMAEGSAAAVAGTQQALAQIAAWLARGTPTYASFTGTDRAWSALCQWLRQRPAVTRLATTPPPAHPDRPATSLRRTIAGIAHPLDVAFCARCLPAPDLRSPQAPLLQLGSQILSYDYLWEEVRAKGGAYGAFCSYDPLAGGFSMTSYSDPDIVRTLGVFDGLQAALGRSAWTGADIERAAIACAREEETPIRPGMATDVALWRYLAGVTQERRREWRQALLQATPGAVREAMLDLLRQAQGEEGTAVLSSRRRLRAAAALVATPLSVRPLASPGRRRGGAISAGRA